jgi:hypothetical protein
MPTHDHPRSSRRRYKVFVEDYKHHRLDETIDALKGPKLPEATPSPPEKGGAVSVFRRALRGKSREHIREYLRWLKPHRFAILTVFLFALIAAGIEMIQPLFMRFIIDRVLLNTALDLSSRLTRLQLAGATYATHALYVAPWPFGRAIAFVSQSEWAVAIAMLMLLFVLFPTGKPLTRRWRVYVALDVVLAVLMVVSTGIIAAALWDRPFSNPTNPPPGARLVANIGFPLITVAIPAMLIAALVCVVLRFRRSRGEERLQMKWFTLAAVFVVLTFVMNFSGSADLFQILSNVALLGLWIAIGIAMLKYRLYDIDVVIRKTLVGGLLVAFVTIVYVVVVAGIGAVGSQYSFFRSGPLIAAATAIRSSYCSLVHGRILATSYYSPGTVVSIAAEDTGDSLDAPDTAVVQFARKVVREAEKITEEDIDELRSLGFSEADIFNIILAAAGRCFFSKVLDATGTLPDAALRDMPDQLRAALTVGRDIAQQA